MARYLPRNRRLTVFTNNLAAGAPARAGKRANLCDGYCVTEGLNSLDSDLTLSLAKGAWMRRLYRAAGFRCGLVNNALPESRLKGVMMNNAEHTYLLADHTKWNARALFDISEWDGIDTFITDERLDPQLPVT